MSGDFQNPKPVLASLPDAQNLKFEREDWTSFRTIEGLQQKAGVSKDKLAHLVLKELTDNGLDTGTEVDVGALPKGGYYVVDTGPGIDGTPEEIARLFSISRPMISTKLLRLPRRGALGNGLRVVAGAVLASEGTLTVITRNQRLQLRPERDGSTTVVSVRPAKFPVGTRIEIKFGPALSSDDDNLVDEIINEVINSTFGTTLSSEDDDPLYWARLANMFARGQGSTYAGKTSPWWYDTPQFHELLSAVSDRPVRELIAQLDGCSGAKAGEIVATAGLSRVDCRDVTAKQAEKLLLAARANARQVSPKRLGAVGADIFSDARYAIAYGVAKFGAVGPQAEIPFAVEVWAATMDDTSLTMCVNRTSVTGDIHASRDRRDIDLFGCGLHHTVAKAPEAVHFNICINITTPYMPITSDGKEPNLLPFFHTIATACKKAVSKAHPPRWQEQHDPEGRCARQPCRRHRRSQWRRTLSLQRPSAVLRAPPDRTNGTDYVAYVGSLFYGGAGLGGQCFSNLSIFQPKNFDSQSGTHVFIGGSFFINASNSLNCTDGEGLIFDRWDINHYTGQGVVEQSLFIGNCSEAWEVLGNYGGPLYFTQSTTWSNGKTCNSGSGGGSEILLSSTGSGCCVTIDRDIAVGTAASVGLWNGKTLVNYPFYTVLNSFFSRVTLSNSYIWNSAAAQYVQAKDGQFPPTQTNITNADRLASPTPVTTAPDCRTAATVLACVASIRSVQRHLAISHPVKSKILKEALDVARVKKPSLQLPSWNDRKDGSP